MKPILEVEIYRSKSLNPKQRWRWRATTMNGRKVANSGEGYKSKSDAWDMAHQLLSDGYEVRYIED